MTYLRYICVALAAALVAAYSTLWAVRPTPFGLHAVTLPPLTVNQQGDSLLLWGGNYRGLLANAVEIRCN